MMLTKKLLHDPDFSLSDFIQRMYDVDETYSMMIKEE